MGGSGPRSRGRDGQDQARRHRQPGRIERAFRDRHGLPDHQPAPSGLALPAARSMCRPARRRSRSTRSGPSARSAWVRGSAHSPKEKLRPSAGSSPRCSASEAGLSGKQESLPRGKSWKTAAAPFLEGIAGRLSPQNRPVQIG
ncbi:MAG: hypothetical protein MZU84_08665 [Sphingobacterium sp.]|nr:hypothetical protein [Sphingobacterium sp.]